MKNPIEKPIQEESKFDLLALVMLRESPEYARWMMGQGIMPSPHSPQNIIRILDFHIGELITASAIVYKAKVAVQNRQWGRARNFTKASAIKFEGVGAYLGSSMNELLVKAAQRDSEIKLMIKKGEQPPAQPTKTL